MAVIALGMCREKPSHPTAKVAVPMRTQDQVEVVGHQTRAEDVHGEAPSSVGDGLDKGVRVGGLMEDVRVAQFGVADGNASLNRAEDSVGRSRNKRSVACTCARFLWHA